MDSDGFFWVLQIVVSYNGVVNMNVKKSPLFSIYVLTYVNINIKAIYNIIESFSMYELHVLQNTKKKLIITKPT